MREYPIRLEKFGISNEVYNELKWFCRQYPDKVAELSTLRGGFGNFAIDGMPRGTDTGNPTESRAMRAMQISKDVEDIEQAAIEADASLYQQIINNVARRVPYERMAVPCGDKQFYAVRRKFFLLLAMRRGKIDH